MNILILKLGATGDVVRTTPLLRKLEGNVTWISAENNIELLKNIAVPIRSLSWDQRDIARDRTYDLLVNLEDTHEVSAFAATVDHKLAYGALLDREHSIAYTENSAEWFDLSLISRFGRTRADQLKLENRSTYQDLVFKGLGLPFSGESYLLPDAIETGLHGDVAISAVAGPVWPMKAWAHYGALQRELEACGYSVNVLPVRKTLLEHLGDIKNHRCLVSGDSLPMHLALGSGVNCVSLFSCTSPWEIYDYGIQVKILSPHLPEFFYQRGFDQRATTVISLKEVFDAVVGQLEGFDNSKSTVDTNHESV